MRRPVRLTAVLTHPIQYYAPWFRCIHATAPEIELTVMHATQPTPKQQGVGFDHSFEWDVPLTDGYRSVVVRQPKEHDRIDSGSLHRARRAARSAARSRDTTPDVVLITGWYSVTLVRALLACRRLACRRSTVATLTCSASRAAGGGRWGAEDARSCCASSTGSCRPVFASASTCAGTACPIIESFTRRTRSITSMFAAAAMRYQHPDARAAARRRWGIDPDAFVVLFVGKLVPFEASAATWSGRWRGLAPARRCSSSAPDRSKTRCAREAGAARRVD